MNEPKFTGAQSVERAVAVVDFVATRANDGCKLADVVAGTGLGRATAYRFLKDLEYLGLLDHDENSGRFFPGVRLVAWGTAGANRFGLAERARPAMRRLAERTSDTIYLVLRSGDEAMCIAREEGSFPIKTLTLKIGDRRPLGVGAGPMAILMVLPDDQIQSILASSASALLQHGLELSVLCEMLADSRRCGFALNQGRMMPDMTGIGVPVLSGDGQPIAALSAAAITSRMEPRRRENIAVWLKEEAERLQGELAPLLGALPSRSQRNQILGGL